MKTTITIKSKQSPISILILTWNTQSINLSEKLGKDSSMGRSYYDKLKGYLYPANDPDFLIPLKKRVLQEKPTIVVIGLQEDSKPGSYAISHAIPETFAPDYVVLRRDRMMGVGKTTWKKLTHYQLPQLRGLRTVILAKTDWWKQKMSCQTKPNLVCHEIPYYKWTRGKGGLAMILNLPNENLQFCFCNVHLPFDASSLYDKNKRNIALNEQNNAFNRIYDECIETCKDETNLAGTWSLGKQLWQWLYRIVPFSLIPRPTKTTYNNNSFNLKNTHFFMFGDLNYRVSKKKPNIMVSLYKSQHSLLKNEVHESLSQVYLNSDELRQQMMKDKIPKMKEGVQGEGPIFQPTAKLDHNRSLLIDNNDPNEMHPFKLGKHKQRIPSWCDRILYQSILKNGGHIECNQYERWDDVSSLKKK